MSPSDALSPPHFHSPSSVGRGAHPSPRPRLASRLILPPTLSPLLLPCFGCLRLSPLRGHSQLSSSRLPPPWRSLRGRCLAVSSRKRGVGRRISPSILLSSMFWADPLLLLLVPACFVSTPQTPRPLCGPRLLRMEDLKSSTQLLRKHAGPSVSSRPYSPPPSRDKTHGRPKLPEAKLQTWPSPSMTRRQQRHAQTKKGCRHCRALGLVLDLEGKW